jgi:tubulin--tyrosine ligase-like protein 12
LTWKWPGFFPATFNLNEELPAFVTYFQKREQLNLDNSFIIKPYNLARGLDTTVTSNLKYVIRVAETGPKLACKYIQNPILFRRPDTGRLVKFDLRYIVLVRSFDPLDVYVYKDFWPRCAINNFDLKTLDDTLAHLSVFNYSEKEKVLNVRNYFLF